MVMRQRVHTQASLRAARLRHLLADLGVELTPAEAERLLLRTLAGALGAEIVPVLFGAHLWCTGCRAVAVPLVQDLAGCWTCPDCLVDRDSSRRGAEAQR